MSVERQPGETPWVEVVKKGMGSKKGKNVCVRKEKPEAKLLCKNKFKTLEVCEEEEKGVLIVWDSNIRRIRNPIMDSVKDKNKNKLRIVGHSGAGVTDCERMLSTELKQMKASKIKVICN